MPLLIGQIIKNFTSFRPQQLPLNSISQCALLFVIYTTFCDTFLVPETGLSALDVLFTVFTGWSFFDNSLQKYIDIFFLVLLLQITLMIISFKLASSKKFYRYFDAQDVIAIIYCSTHKSLTLGKSLIFKTYRKEIMFFFRNSYS